MKKLLPIFIAIMISAVMCGCNYSGYDWVDTNYHFDTAYIKTPAGEVIEVEVSTWADSEGEQITITGTDGTRYLVHSANVLMVEGND